ncbi:hypothetical protein DLAC_10916 [Tieghemostelium lacteum]|uniref:FHA domain-containing protein n=1 Tax=Tieghemostelium lacteum TaxID=361077 RepID=A0A151Z2P7_TIELA|nr:hypothetical protein DLAC_10916 [Tieghemostelium lacteum]|eukprot:KYQ88232.1 hypothetical protein DLAC_10916 [Tieghemostelium lacteum]
MITPEKKVNKTKDESIGKANPKPKEKTEYRLKKDEFLKEVDMLRNSHKRILPVEPVGIRISSTLLFRKEKLPKERFNAFLVYSYLPALPKNYLPFILLDLQSMTHQSLFVIGGNDLKSKLHLSIGGLATVHTLIDYKGSNNYAIIDVSTVHENIDIDLGTGTYVNEFKLKPLCEAKLVHNDRLTFGDQNSDARYTFKVLSELSTENHRIFEYLITLKSNKQIQNHPLSKLFTPLLVINPIFPQKENKAGDTSYDINDDDEDEDQNVTFNSELDKSMISSDND